MEIHVLFSYNVNLSIITIDPVSQLHGTYLVITFTFPGPRLIEAPFIIFPTYQNNAYPFYSFYFQHAVHTCHTDTHDVQCVSFHPRKFAVIRPSLGVAVSTMMGLCVPRVNVLEMLQP